VAQRAPRDRGAGLAPLRRGVGAGPVVGSARRQRGGSAGRRRRGRAGAVRAGGAAGAGAGQQPGRHTVGGRAGSDCRLPRIQRRLRLRGNGFPAGSTTTARTTCAPTSNCVGWHCFSSASRKLAPATPGATCVTNSTARRPRPARAAPLPRLHTRQRCCRRLTTCSRAPGRGVTRPKPADPAFTQIKPKFPDSRSHQLRKSGLTRQVVPGAA
jgi:hypothetical protein